MGPSRADEADDWSKTKKFGGGFGERGGDRGERREKGGFFGSSRADEVDNWGANKSSFVEPPRRERRGVSFGTDGGADGDNWLKRKEERATEGGGDTWGRRENGVGGGERPRLNLQKRTLPVPEIEVSEERVKEKEVEEREKLEIVRVKGVNPFGEARPREEVLKELGKDWKEIDEKLEAVKIKEKEAAVGSEEKDGERFGGRRRGFGLGKGENGGEEKSVRSWRKNDSNGVLASPTNGVAAAAPSRFD